jgi:phosphohistidine phosphatase
MPNYSVAALKIVFVDSRLRGNDEFDFGTTPPVTTPFPSHLKSGTVPRMKILTLFRHGKSGWDSAAARDFDRPINERGIRGSRLMGEWVNDQGLEFDTILSSPAVRCIETLDAFWEGYGRILHPNWDRRIYLASGATLLDVVHDQEEEGNRMLMCGHNPGLEDLAMELVPLTPDDVLRDALEEKFPTASIAEISFDVDRWADIKEGHGKLTRFIRPRDLDPDLGPQLD